MLAAWPGAVEYCEWLHCILLWKFSCPKSCLHHRMPNPNDPFLNRSGYQGVHLVIELCCSNLEVYRVCFKCMNYSTATLSLLTTVDIECYVYPLIILINVHYPVSMVTIIWYGDSLLILPYRLKWVLLSLNLKWCLPILDNKSFKLDANSDLVNFLKADYTWS